MDRRLIEILCDPVTKVSVAPMSKAQLAALNREIERGEVLNVDGDKVAAPLSEGLITTDGKVIYRVDDGIPVMLAEEGIGTTQLADFPR
ncbi:MAG TPA: hypothetical protein VND91_00555 [Candidatus Saccharimonadia bacterium]|nr:hypothetical protein [Candidatus Saccharimonadia bacterium]